ncbi:helix-turn-helix domain-containing protein [Streptomyces chartreusis]|uniref:helix-turn-helix domain-containing protein n=1 Tax=Streptomyces chartreusis TaxID=1969 RepID=UPI002E82139E|nr:helix-turn-helix domain-containing protein [Streptomyces chartreusis]WUB18324.1 helix-turn-helix domain-containing protein [Streptomyces chartreusis]
MASKRNPLGPVGEVVRQNVETLREEQNLSLVGLSRRLAELGRPIPTLGLSRIENGERRVDADDLVALAAALGVSPVTLLLPREDPAKPVALAEHLTAPSWQVAWRWMHGEVPLAARWQWTERFPWLAANRPYLAEEELQKIVFSHPIQPSVEAMEGEGDDGPGS